MDLLFQYAFLKRQNINISQYCLIHIVICTSTSDAYVAVEHGADFTGWVFPASKNISDKSTEVITTTVTAGVEQELREGAFDPKNEP